MRVLRTAGPLLAVGAASLIWQVASARALLEGMRGNELGLGLVLMCWLLMIALGSAAGGLLVRGDAAGSLLPSILLLTPLGLLLSLVLQSGPALADPAVLVGPARTVALSLLSLGPACLFLGAAFALAARATGGIEPGVWASRVFSLEALGTAVAGLLFHFVLARTSLRTAGLVAGILCWAAALPLLGGRRSRIWLLPLLSGTAALLYLAPGWWMPGSRWLQAGVPGYRLLEHRNSPHAALAVLARGDQLLFTASGQVVYSNQDEQLVESEVHLSLLAHAAPERLLLIGGGLGRAVEEALQHRPRQIDYVELDPALVDLARRHAPALTSALRDPRVRLHLGDGRQVLRRSAPQSYDLVLIGLPGPSTALTNRFYTEELFRTARRALRPGGLLRVGLEGGEGYLSQAALLAHRSVTLAMRAAGLHPAVLPGQSTLLLGGRDAPPDLEPRKLLSRLAARRLRTRFFGPADVLDRTLPFKREVYEEALRGGPQLRVGSNRDLHPAAYFEASLLWLAVGSPELAARLLRLGEIAWRWPWLAPLVGLALGLLGGALRRRRPAAGLALFAAGFAGLALELQAVLVCQLARGVVYRELGLLLAGFMLGLAGGALAGRRLLAAAPRWALSLALGATTFSALLSLVLLPAALQHPAGALALLLLGLLLLGASVGSCYPPAAACLAARHGAAASARAYVWDLLGASLGSLLAGGLLLPVLGVTGTSALCAALCGGCTLALRRGP